MFYRTGSTILGAVLLAALAFAAPAFAAKGGGSGPKTGGGYGSCSSTGTVVGGQYTVNGWGFKANELLNVYVQDSHGTQAFMIGSDALGNFSVTSYASWAGTDTVTVYDNGGRKMVYLTTCSFTVS